MKSNDTPLQPSEKLAPFVAPYRDEPSMLSSYEIGALLEHHDRLPNRPPRTIRKIIMTLAGLVGIGLVLYRAFSGSPAQDQNAPKLTAANSSHVKQSVANAELRSKATDSTRPNTPRPEHSSHRPFASPASPSIERPAYAAPGDQVFADLTPEQLARLGILVSGDTIIQYNLNRKGDASMMKLTTHFFEGSERSDAPTGIVVSNLSPVLMTQGDGHSAAFHYEDSNGFTWGMTGDEQKHYAEAINYLDHAGVPGLHVLHYRHFSYDSRMQGAPVVHWDSVVVEIGRDIESLPFVDKSIPSDLPDSIRTTLSQLSEYYLGKRSKLDVSLPDKFWVRADTFTAQQLIARYDEEKNRSNQGFIQSTLKRLNELVPVLVRVDSKRGNPSARDYIFWYEPSEELFAALPESQVKLLRKSVQRPYCLTAPNSISKDAHVRYCSAVAQPIQAVVQNLTGHIIRIVQANAHIGDNTLVVPTEVLPTGMYVITLKMRNGSQECRRIWSENSSPEPLPQDSPTFSSDSERFIFTFPTTFTAEQLQAYVSQKVEFDNSLLDYATNLTPSERARLESSLQEAEESLIAAHTALANEKVLLDSLSRLPFGLSYVVLSNEAALDLGVENSDSLVRFYSPTGNGSEIVGLSVERNWGLLLGHFVRSSIRHPLPKAIPSLVTDGIGRKRLTVTTSDDDTSINALIPILFRAIAQDTLGSRDLILWYRPTREFLAALPDSIRTKVGGNPTASLRVNGHRVLRSLHSYPNPSHGLFTLDINVGSACRLAIIARNLLGQELARTSMNVREGPSSERVDFSTLEDGIYILEITTDAGETQMSRIVIEH